MPTFLTPQQRAKDSPQTVIAALFLSLSAQYFSPEYVYARASAAHLAVNLGAHTKCLIGKSRRARYNDIHTCVCGFRKDPPTQHWETRLDPRLLVLRMNNECRLSVRRSAVQVVLYSVWLTVASAILVPEVQWSTLRTALLAAHSERWCGDHIRASSNAVSVPR